MGIIDDLHEALDSTLDQLAKRNELWHQRFWAEVVGPAEEAGVTSIVRRGSRLSGRVAVASLEGHLQSGEDGRISCFKWCLDSALDRSIVLRTPNALERVGAFFGQSSPAVRVGKNRVTRFLVTDDILGRAHHLSSNHAFQLMSDLLVSIPGLDFSGLADQVALVEAIAARWRDRLLPLDRLGFGPSGRGIWNARIDGVAVMVRETWSGSLATTTVHAALNHPLPAGTRIEKRKKKRAPRARHCIGDFMLDHVLIGRSSDMAAVRARLAREPARSELLGLLGTHRGSYLLHDEVVVRLPGAVVDDCEVPALVRLVRALDDGHVACP